MKKSIIISILAFLCVVGIVVAAEVVQNFYGNSVVNIGGGEELSLGAVTPTGGICNGSEPATTMCNVSIYELGVDTSVAIDEDLTVGDDVAITGDLVVTGTNAIGGMYEDWVTGSCIDASTTILSVANPWGATAYVDKFIIDIQAGTSSGAVTCGTTTVVGLSADPSDLLIDDLETGTSTAGTATTTVRSMNGLAGGARTAASGFGLPGTNSEDVIRWRSSEYIACFFDPTGFDTDSTGVTGGKNIFTCNYYIHTIKAN